MRKILAILIMCFVGCFVTAQNNSPENYSKVKTYTSEGGQSYVEDVDFYDGLGRPVMSVNIGASPEGFNTISPVFYDAHNRSNSMVYMPYVSKNKGFVKDENPFSSDNYIIYGSEESNYAVQKNVFESSSDRIKRSYRPGKAYADNDKYAEYSYDFNTRNDVVLSIKKRNSQLYASFFDDKQLQKRQVIDEDGRKYISFVDFEDRVVLERKEADCGFLPFADTYYVYDDLGHLIFVLPPMVFESLFSDFTANILEGRVEEQVIDESILNNYAYQYVYNKKGHVVGKKAPNKDWEYYIYDENERLALSQDGNQRTRSEKEFTQYIYDNFGRLIEQNIIESAMPEFNTELSIDPNQGYGWVGDVEVDLDECNRPITLGSGDVVKTQLFLISYGIVGYSKYAEPSKLNFKSIPNVVENFDARVKTYKTYEKIAVLNGESDKAKSIERAYYYDKAGRVVQIVESNYFGSISRYSTKYDFSGKVLSTHEYHEPNVKIEDPYVYARYLQDSCLVITSGSMTASGGKQHTDLLNKYFNAQGSVHLKYLFAKETVGSGFFSKTKSYYYIPQDLKSIVESTVALQGNSDYSITSLPSQYKIAGYKEGVKDVMTNKFLKQTDIALISGGLTVANIAQIDSEGKYFISGTTDVNADYEINVNIASGVSQNTYYYIPLEYVDIIEGVVNHSSNKGQFSVVTDLPVNLLGVIEPRVWVFAGNITEMPSESTESVPFDEKSSEFAYDHRGRLLSQSTTINNKESVHTMYEYDKLGRLKYTHLSKNKISTTSIPVEIENGVGIRFNTSLLDNNSDINLREKISEYMYYITGKDSFDDYQYIDNHNNINPAYFLYKDDSDPNYSYYCMPMDWEWQNTVYHVILDISGYFDTNDIPMEIVNISGDIIPSIVHYSVKSEQPFFTETYDFNIQGWMTSKNNDLFEMHLKYYDPEYNGVDPSYTGNITQSIWRHKDQELDHVLFDSYAYSYDKMNRLSLSRKLKGFNGLYDLSNEHAEAGGIEVVDNNLQLSPIEYDLQGNIKRLSRSGESSDQIDELIYSYGNGHQLSSVKVLDPKTRVVKQYKSYSYDANGNTLSDGRDLSYSYNSLNLVSEVKRTELDESKFGKVVFKANYAWLANGTKVQVLDNSGNGYLYLGSFVYAKQNEGDWKLQSAGFDGGQFIVSEVSGGNNTYTPHYSVTDHLGSVRSVFTCDSEGNLNVVAQNDYYAFGKKHENSFLVAGDDTKNRYLYNGKENQTLGDIGLLDYGWRMYDPEIGRWLCIDPMAESYYSHSPYNYCGNNPVNRIDPDGRKWVNNAGKPVYENGRWTEHASDFDKYLGFYLKLSPFGTDIFNALLGHPNKIAILTFDYQLYNKENERVLGRARFNVSPKSSTLLKMDAIHFIELYIPNIAYAAQKDGVKFVEKLLETTYHEYTHFLILNVFYSILEKKAKDAKDRKEMWKWFLKSEEGPRRAGQSLADYFRRNIGWDLSTPDFMNRPMGNTLFTKPQGPLEYDY